MKLMIKSETMQFTVTDELLAVLSLESVFKRNQIVVSGGVTERGDGLGSVGGGRPSGMVSNLKAGTPVTDSGPQDFSRR